MSVCNLRGLNDFFRSSGRLAQSNVVLHAQGEQRAILHHDADLGTQGLYRVRTYILAINQNSASQGSWRRNNRLAMVDLPPPEGPTSTTFWPGLTSKLTFRSATRCGSYSKDTFSKRMCPLNGGATAASASSLISRGVVSRPRIRSPEASARAICPRYFASWRMGLKPVRR